jgi:quercetin dioxygenase-like cupin family protein
MQDRRTFLALAAASLLPISIDTQTAAQTPAPPPGGAAAPRPGGELARHALTGPFEGFEAVVTQVTVPPGQPDASAQGQGHRHSGFVLGYVLEGQLRFAINNEPERIMPAGSTFFEPIGALHSTNGATPDAPARFLAFLVVPKGSPIVVPIAAK